MNSVDKTISDSKDSGTLYQAFFEHAPVALLMVDFSCVKQYLETLKLRTVPDIKKHLTDFPEDVYRCFSQVRIHKSNRSSLTIFNAESEQELVDNLHQLAAPDAFESHLELILAIADKKTVFENVSRYKKITGESMDVYIRWWACPNGNQCDDIFAMSITDITALKKQELSLHINDHAIASSINAIVFMDLAGTVTYANPAFLKMWGYERFNQVIGRNIHDFWQNLQAAQQVSSHIQNHAYFLGELAAVRKDRSVFDVQVSASAVRDDRGHLLCMMASFVDITEKKRLAAELIRNEAIYRSLIESFPEPIFVIQDYKVVYCNPSISQLTGCAPELFIGQHIQDAVPPEELDVTLQRYHDIIERQMVPQPREIKRFHKDGAVLYFTEHSHPFFYHQKPASLAFLHDITEEKKMRDELVDHQEQLRLLVNQLILTEEQERKRLSLELHDNISQSLALTKMTIDQLAQSGDQPASVSLKQVSTVIENCLDQLQSITFELGSPTLYTFGLTEAIQNWLRDSIVRQYPLDIQFHADGPYSELPEELKAFLFRSIKELVMNIIKHAKAEKAQIEIHTLKKTIQVVVSDNGIGFQTTPDKKKTDRKGYGLLSLQERLRHLGGTISIETVGSRGTRITITIQHT